MAITKQTNATSIVKLLNLNCNEFCNKFDSIDGVETLVTESNVLTRFNHIGMSDKPYIGIQTLTVDANVALRS